MLYRPPFVLMQSRQEDDLPLLERVELGHVVLQYNYVYLEDVFQPFYEVLGAQVGLVRMQ